MMNFNAKPEQSETIITETFSLELELKKMNIRTVKDFAREFPNEFIKIAVDEIGAVEFAGYLHETHDLFELNDGLLADAVEMLEEESDYRSQINYNWRNR